MIIFDQLIWKYFLIDILPIDRQNKVVLNFKGGIFLSKKAYLEITMVIPEENRSLAAKVYNDYRTPFLNNIPGALSKELLVRKDDIQVLHGFDSIEHAEAYLDSTLFKDDVFVALKDLWTIDPDVRIYDSL